jgi:hypothetical protein
MTGQHTQVLDVLRCWSHIGVVIVVIAVKTSATAAPQAVLREKEQGAPFKAITLALGHSHESPEVHTHTGHVAW